MGSTLDPNTPSRSPLSVGLEWATRLTALGLEFSLPVLLGYWADRRWGLAPWGVLGGAVLGFIVGFLGLLQMVRPRARA